MEKERIVTRSFILCFIAEFCSALIFYMLITTATDFAGQYGAVGALAGLVSGIFVVGVLITRFMFSRILQVIGWKKMMYLSQILHLLSLFLYFTISSLPTLILVRFVHGLFYGLSSSCNLSVGTSQIPKSRYGEGTGIFMTSITLAIAVGPYLGGLIMDIFGSKGCFTGAIIATVIMCVTAFSVTLPPNPKKNEKAKEKGLNSLIEVAAIPITLCALIAGLGYSSVLSFLRLYAKSINMMATVGYFFLAYALVLILTRPVAGKIQDKHGDAAIMFPCIIMQVLSHLILALFPTTIGFVISGVLCAAGYGTLASCISAISSREAPLDRKPYAVATYWIGCDLANGIGPVLLGAVSESAGYSSMYLGAAVLAAVVAPFYLLSRRLYKR
ncbi:MAG: MFS transporter [Lachnospiraceae bacterium]|nr:MFS transporter [Lachnospiraceae bacterium]